MSSNKRPASNSLAATGEARAGLSFTSDHVKNELFASTSRIAPTVQLCAKSRPGQSVAITDMLTDLRHYCDTSGLSFDELDALACENYWDEKADIS
jgi:hypothetical protein